MYNIQQLWSAWLNCKIAEGMKKNLHFKQYITFTEMMGQSAFGECCHSECGSRCATLQRTAGTVLSVSCLHRRNCLSPTVSAHCYQCHLTTYSTLRKKGFRNILNCNKAISKLSLEMWCFILFAIFPPPSILRWIFLDISVVLHEHSSLCML